LNGDDGEVMMMTKDDGHEGGQRACEKDTGGRTRYDHRAASHDDGAIVVYEV
jgi:hypothetical protein